MDPVTSNEMPLQVERGPHESYLGALARALVIILNRFAQRINQTLPKDGSEAMDGPLPLKSYLTADLPAAGAHEGAFVYVSDGLAMQKVRYSDGSTWVILG